MRLVCSRKCPSDTAHMDISTDIIKTAFLFPVALMSLRGVYINHLKISTVHSGYSNLSYDNFLTLYQFKICLKPNTCRVNEVKSAIA